MSNSISHRPIDDILQDLEEADKERKVLQQTRENANLEVIKVDAKLLAAKARLGHAAYEIKFHQAATNQLEQEYENALEATMTITKRS